MPGSTLKQAPVTIHLVSTVTYATEDRANKPTNLRIDYWGARDVVMSERIFPFEGGINTQMAQQWMKTHTPPRWARQSFDLDRQCVCVPEWRGYEFANLYDWVDKQSRRLRRPHKIVVDRTGDSPRIIEYHFGGEAIPA
jgi:hypothetical protein